MNCDEPSQFIREYKKLFGAPTTRDVVSDQNLVVFGLVFESS